MDKFYDGDSILFLYNPFSTLAHDSKEKLKYEQAIATIFYAITVYLYFSGIFMILKHSDMKLKKKKK